MGPNNLEEWEAVDISLQEQSDKWQVLQVTQEHESESSSWTC